MIVIFGCLSVVASSVSHACHLKMVDVVYSVVCCHDEIVHVAGETELKLTFCLVPHDAKLKARLHPKPNKYASVHAFTIQSG